jgi:MFS family permease
MQRKSSLSLPRGVWILGFVSLFMDMSSEIIHALLPIFLVGTLGASMVLLGMIEGLAEATAQIVKLFSGWLSDRLGNRKMLTLAGYGLAAAVKPLFPIAATPMAVVFARVADRIGKGIRGAPRDALVADITPPELRGAAFGLRQSLDTAGAFIGPLIAFMLMAFALFDVRTVLWFACIPALAAVAMLAFGIKEPERAASGKPPPRLDAQTIRQLPRAFWLTCAMAAMFMMARFSEAFLIVKASDVGLSTAYIPLVLTVMSLAYALTSYPVGILSDRLGRRSFLIIGLLLLIAADIVLAQSSSISAMFAGVALWGLHMGFTQGILSTLVADAAPADLRGTAFGVFNFLSGIAAFAASVLAGWLWSASGSAATFHTGAAFSAATIVLIFAISSKRG